MSVGEKLIMSAFAAMLVALPATADDQAKTRSQPRPLTLIPPGTKVPANDLAASVTGRWNRVVLVALPVISSGDVDQLTEGSRKAASTYRLTILATVDRTRQSDGAVRHQLREIGVGYSVPIEGTLTVITWATAKQLGVRLGFVRSHILSLNEQRLADVVSVRHTSTMSIFDAPALMLQDGKHVDYITRHLVWIDPETGKSATIIWLMNKDAAGQLQPANEPLRLITGTREQRKIHVDGSEFLLGFPTERAFALEDLPPGAKIAWTRELTSVAALPKYSSDELVRLSKTLNQAIRDAATR